MYCGELASICDVVWSVWLHLKNKSIHLSDDSHIKSFNSVRISCYETSCPTHKVNIDIFISYDFNVFSCVDTDVYIFNNNHWPIKHCFKGIAS